VFLGALLILTSVSVPGTDLAVKLTSQVGQPYDEQKVTQDVRYLWNLGRFDDVRVEQPEPTSLVFRVHSKPNLMLRDIWLHPNTFGIEVKARDGIFLDAERAHEIAREAARQLEQHGYTNPKIREEITPRGDGSADLHLYVTPGDNIKVKGVTFEGDDRYRNQVKALRPLTILPRVGFFPGWRMLAGYNQDAADSDIARIQSTYLRNGFLHSTVRPGDVKVDNGSATVGIVVSPGPQTPLPRDFCRNLLSQRREAQQQGILDFTARYDTETGLTVERGPAYHVGRIEFQGNHHFSDTTIRRNFVIDEGDVFDELLLRRSVARINRAAMFDPIDEKHVIVHPDPKTGYADITLRVTERKRGRWNLSGPVGPLSLAGPLQASITSRLPGWSSYAFSISLFAFGRSMLPILNAPPAFLPVLSLQRAFMPGEGWKSGFAIAPQLGWQQNVMGYGVSQLEGRLMPRLTGERNAQPPLAVTVSRPEGESTMFCEVPKPRLAPLRATAGVALHFLGALPMM
jgi:outer membrane protein insertion porin family